jgi:hypothetical protein
VFYRCLPQTPGEIRILASVCPLARSQGKLFVIFGIADQFHDASSVPAPDHGVSFYRESVADLRAGKVGVSGLAPCDHPAVAVEVSLLALHPAS